MALSISKISMSVSNQLNALADRHVTPTLVIRSVPVSSFQACGYTGLLLAHLLTFGLVWALGLSFAVMAAIAVSAMLTFLALAMVTKIIVGEERLIYYHHEIAVMASAALIVRLLGQPVLPYLDVTILGIGTFLVCGRIGCLMVGCCHGRPHGWGVCYSDAHAAAGFTPQLVGVRLFPIQAVESLWVLAAVSAGVAMTATGSPAGWVLAWYIVAYDIGRFLFEFARGDASRVYLGGFSEAQWTSLVLMLLVVWLEHAGHLPHSAWHLAATAGVALVMLSVAVARYVRGPAEYRLATPRHVLELAQALDPPAASPAPGSVPDFGAGSRSFWMAGTSQGIQISSGHVTTGAATVYHYTLSRSVRTLDRRGAAIIARLIAQLRHQPGSTLHVIDRGEVFHVVIDSAPPGSAVRDTG